MDPPTHCLSPPPQAPLVDVDDEDEVFISNERIVSPAPAPPLFGGVSDEAEAAPFGPATAPSAAPATEPAPRPPLPPPTNPVVALLYQDSAAPAPPSPSQAPASAPPPPPPARLPSTGSAGKQSSRRGSTGEGKGGKTGASGFTFAGKSMDRARLL